MMKIMLETSDTWLMQRGLNVFSPLWLMSRSSHRTIDPAYYIEDCQIFENLKGIWVRSGVQPINIIDNELT